MLSRILSLIRINALCSACLVLLVFTGATHAYIEKGGNVSGETWAAETYLVTSDLTVSDDTVLTVEAGAIIKFAGGKELDVYGRLDVNGVEGNPVVFTSLYDDTYGGDTNNDGNATSPSPGNWHGIYLHGEDDNDGIGEFDHCIIRYGAGGHLTKFPMSNLRFHESTSGHFINSVCEYSYRYGMIIVNCSPHIANSTFYHNSENGLRVGGGSPTINGNTFEDNGDYAASIWNVDIHTGYSGNTGSGNRVNGFQLGGIAGGTLSGTFPYVLYATRVSKGLTLTLEPGVVIKAGGSESDLHVYGTLDVNGEEGNPVIFTSLHDDTYGGDTNNDGSATSPSPGNWRGIYLHGEDDNDGIGDFDHCIIRYGGGGNLTKFPMSNLRFHESTSGHFINSVCEYSYRYGMIIVNCSPHIANSTFYHNSENGLRVGGGSPTINGNTFEDNGDYAASIWNVDIHTGYSGNTGSGNRVNGFQLGGIAGGTLSGTFPYVLYATRVSKGLTLTLEPGVIIKAGGGESDLHVYGTLDVNGEEGNPVIFTSLHDDTYGGDTNNDGSATSPSPGNWRGIYLHGEDDNDGIGEFDHCIIRYGGGGHLGSEPMSNIRFHESTSGHFINSVCEYSYRYGVIVNNSSPCFRRSRIEGNNDYGVFIIGNSNPDLGPNDPADMGKNVFLNNDNGNYQICNTTPNTINAHYNYWGYTTAAEIDAHIYDDDQSISSGEVLFEPWLSEDPGDQFSFAHITDMHIGGWKKWETFGTISGSFYTIVTASAYTSFTDMLEYISSCSLPSDEKPELLLISGDNVDYNKEAFFGQFVSALKTFTDANHRIQAYFVPGNHDRYEHLPFIQQGAEVIGGGNDRLMQYHISIGEPEAGSVHILPGFPQSFTGDSNVDKGIDCYNYYFTYKNHLFIGLDSGSDCMWLYGKRVYGMEDAFDLGPESNGLSSTHIDALYDLSKVHEIPKIIFMHHPVVTGRKDLSALPFVLEDASIVNERDEFLDYGMDNMGKVNKVRLVLSGHTHENHIFDKNGQELQDNGQELQEIGNVYPYFIQTTNATNKESGGFSYRLIKIDGVTISKKNNEIVPLPKILAYVIGPLTLNAYDPKGRHTGCDSYGEIITDIPNSYYTGYYDALTPQTIVLYGIGEEYSFELVGTDFGYYILNVTSINAARSNILSADEGNSAFAAIGIPMQPEERHKYYVDWDILSEEVGVTVQIDSDGDGVFEETVDTGFIYGSGETFSISLHSGWNLVSLPLRPFDIDPSMVLSSIDRQYNSVWAYDPDAGWSTYAPGVPSALEQMVPCKGYWIKMNEPGDLIVQGTAPESTAVLLKGAKWNLAGYCSLETKDVEDCNLPDCINSVWEYNADPQNSGWSIYASGGPSDLVSMKPGFGYWIKVREDHPEDCVWDVNQPISLAAPPLTMRTKDDYVSEDRPEMPYMVWGSVEVDGEKITGDSTVILKVDGKIQSSYTLGTVEGYGDSYVLGIPAVIDSLSRAELYIQIDGNQIKFPIVPPGRPGDIIRLDLSVRTPPKISMLHQNYPNPFNPDTWIPYQLSEDVHVVIKIYAATGQLVRTLNLGHKPAGFYTDKAKAAYWDGKNEAGEHVASGIYFCTIQASKFAATRKMVMTR